MNFGIWLCLIFNVAAGARLQKRIFGDIVLTNSKYTWLVRITKWEPDPRICTGVLIYSKYVLTTASCLGTNVDELIRSMISLTYIEIGTPDREFRVAVEPYHLLNSSLISRVFKVETRIPHDDYLMKNQRHSGNLAILKLENHAHLNDILLDYGKTWRHPISSVRTPLKGDIGLYIGWPQEGSKQGLIKPEYTFLIVKSKTFCSKAFGREYDHDSQFCATKVSTTSATLDT
ncbi:unnamed protein product, partial [Dicrocoelium dendriticum]